MVSSYKLLTIIAIHATSLSSSSDWFLDLFSSLDVVRTDWFLDLFSLLDVVRIV